ncbi:M20 family metallopeptidase [Xanthobacter variabilis]|uniref:M20 family metallopeptidase n=1 Tax=Xanthobacter variabilis TaxID=3119932 RepID=UPI003728373C
MIDPVELTRTLIQFRSVNPPGDEAACAEHLANLLEDAGFDTALHTFGEKRVNVVARRGCSGDRSTPPICFTGHLDTVPIGAASWSFDPFAGEVRDGRILGRGSSDMKAGVAAMVVAATELADRVDEGPGVLLVLTGGEETGCEGATFLAGHDGVLGEAGAIIVGEPTGNQPRVGHKGALWLAASCTGRTAHGSMPDLGVNAIYRGMTMLEKLKDFGFNQKPHDGLGSPTLNVGRVNGGMNINSVPDLIEFGVDIRTTPGMVHDKLFHDINRYLEPELDRLDRLVDLESVWTSPNDPWMQQAIALLAPPEKPEPAKGVPFFTDASILKPAFGNVPTLILGPGETHMAHQVDEYCRIDRLLESVEIYKQLILCWNQFGAYMTHTRSEAPTIQKSS